MKLFNAILMAAIVLPGPAATGATYSTDATMSLQKDDCTYNVVVKISELTERDGKVTERLISQPRIKSTPGVPASLYVGGKQGDPTYREQENISVDVTWPFPNESGTASCAVVVRRGDEIVSKSTLRLNVDGPGRVPLVLPVEDVNPASVKVATEKSQVCVLLELAGKTKQDVKKLANENYGNKVQIRDRQGHLTDGGLSFGTYHDIGLALVCTSKEEADRLAGVLADAR